MNAVQDTNVYGKNIYVNIYCLCWYTSSIVLIYNYVIVRASFSPLLSREQIYCGFIYRIQGQCTDKKYMLLYVQEVETHFIMVLMLRTHDGK